MSIPIISIFAKITLIVLATLPALANANQPCDIETTKKSYLQLDTNDREVRREFVRNLEALSQAAKDRGTEISDQEMITILRPLRDTDKKNQALLEEIVSTCGWPTYEKWGATAVYAAVTVALHSPQPIRKKYFPNVEHGYKRGDVAVQEYAQYVDKLLTGENKPQRYGTQRSKFKDQPEQIKPVEDPAHLNDRRQAIGLKPLGDFPMPSNWPSSQPQSASKADSAAAPQATNTK
ncbi:MAG: hypothetical protein RL748_1473 [Pseudomonadota bacterium]|jgi:hypothetical protein